MSDAEESQPTPISVIMQLYQNPNQNPLVIDEINEMDISSQIQYLDPDKCNSQSHRSEIIKQFNNADLSRNAFKRIRLKSMLCQYTKHWHMIKTKHFKMVQNWDNRDFALSVIVHFIQNDTERDHKRLNITWRFLNYLVQFFDKHGYDGKEFITNHVGSSQNAAPKGGGFGLKMVKQVCQQFHQKTGKFTKVKKQLTSWGKIYVERHQQEIAFNIDDIKQSVGKKKKDETNEIVEKKNDGDKIDKGEKWYWFCDEGSTIKWIPYRDDQQQTINTAWNDNKQNVIIMERFKIDFKRENGGCPAGQQYNYQVQNSWRRDVIRGHADNNGMLRDILCDAHPR